jgi:hypothetical protein
MVVVEGKCQVTYYIVSANVHILDYENYTTLTFCNSFNSHKSYPTEKQNLNLNIA